MAIPKRPWRISKNECFIVSAEGVVVLTIDDIVPNAPKFSRECAEHIINSVNKYNEAEEAKRNPNLCVVCHRNPVCPEMGYDTCDWCLPSV